MAGLLSFAPKSAVLFEGESITPRGDQPSHIILIPDFLVSLIPLAAGVYIIIRSFSLYILGLIIVLLILAFPLTGYIRGSIACKFCRQKEDGCGAIQLFEKDEQRV